MIGRFLNVALIACVLLSSQAFAEPISITSYDITNARLSGTGNWHHTYNGSIQATGQGDNLYNYTGGSGTLNDGIIGTGLDNTQLFVNSDNSAITLYLGKSAVIDTLELFSFMSGNAIPGALSSLNVTINSITVNLATIGFGDEHWLNDFINDRISLSGTALEGLITDTIILSGFSTLSPHTAMTAISEIKVYGTEVEDSALISEPEGLILLAIGLIGLGLIRRRKLNIR